MINQNLLLAGDDGYNLTNSLRFRSSASAYLNRTFGTPTINTTWTFSFWVKRGALSTNQGIISAGTSAIEYVASTDTIKFYAAGPVSVATSTSVYRDPAAWGHWVITSNGTTVVAYFNNVSFLSYTGTLPQFNSAISHSIGRYAGGGDQFDGYLTEVNFIDGQALTPTSFGSFNALTGVWQPAKYTGTYGTNGFYLPFTDNSALTTSSNVGLGKDFSGNGNYWTTNNISITSGATYDSMTDVPTLTSATTANYAVWNPLETNAALGGGTTEANLLGYPSNTANTGQLKATINFPTTGKFYFEITPIIISSATSIIGILKSSISAGTSPASAGDMYAYQSDGNKYNGSVATSYGATYTTNDVIGVAFDIDGGTITFYKNGTTQGQAYTGITGEYVAAARDGTASGVTQYAANFGQRPFSYTPPTGFVALNTFNLPNSTIVAGNKQFNTVLWTGNGSTPRSFTGIGFAPDFAWIKSRSTSADHALIDSVRGTGSKALVSNTTSAENGDGLVINSFDSDGYTLATGTFNFSYANTNTASYVSWNWKAGGTAVTNTAGTISSQVSANTTSGFSVVTYTGTGVTATIGHGLGVAPSMVIVKLRSSSGENWNTWHTSLNNTAARILLNTTAAVDTGSPTIWGTGGINPTSTTFQIGTNSGTNGSSSTYVAYCFAPIAGYSAFGSYTGNGSADGPFVFTGFRPRFVMIKRTDGIGNWSIYDTRRDPYNVMTQVIFGNLSDAESNNTATVDYLSNGFKLRIATFQPNTSGATFIYMAFAENPFKNSLAR